MWTNELGKGNTHTLDNIPYVMVGGGFRLQDGPQPQIRQSRAQLPPLDERRPSDGPTPQTFGKRNSAKAGSEPGVIKKRIPKAGGGQL